MAGTASPGKATKYARLERERRFLLARRPDGLSRQATRVIDRYINGTQLRLRQTIDASGDGEQHRPTTYKLTKKLSAGNGLAGITTIYLNADEHQILERLPATQLLKTRLHLDALLIDVFEDQLTGLVIAEAEFADDNAMRDFSPPPFAIAEITQDQRLTGARLATTSASQLAEILTELT
jgi:CYTH domain-containing protein